MSWWADFKLGPKGERERKKRGREIEYKVELNSYLAEYGDAGVGQGQHNRQFQTSSRVSSAELS